LPSTASVADSAIAAIRLETLDFSFLVGDRMLDSGIQPAKRLDRAWAMLPRCSDRLAEMQ
jgi:hypothetical protein